MKRRNPLPTVDQTFLRRICAALDMKPTELAEVLEVPYADIYQMLNPRPEVVEIDRDEIWWQIAGIVDEQLGLLMAVRLELSKALQKDRTQRALRHAQVRERAKKPSPR